MKTLEEVRAEAAARGYTLKKIYPEKKKTPFLPCLCGGRRHYTRTGWSLETGKPYHYFICIRCGTRSNAYPGQNEEEARKGWNRMMEEKIKRDMQTAKELGEDMHADT